jgi:hypothetical protein
VFLNFINNNFESFTEKDVQGIIELHLRKNLNFKQCDPFKIEEIISSVSNIQFKNSETENKIEQIGQILNDLTKKSLEIKKYQIVEDTKFVDLGKIIGKLT